MKPCQNQFEVGGKYIYAFDNEAGHTEALVEIVRKFNKYVVINILEVYEEHTGNNFLAYHCRTGKMFNASYEFLTEMK